MSDKIKLFCQSCIKEWTLPYSAWSEIVETITRKCPKCGSVMKTDRDDCIEIETEICDEHRTKLLGV